MDHEYIQEHQIVALFAMGKLAPADRLGFEEHLVDCRQCQDELELTDDFRHALRQVAEEDEFRGGVPRTVAGWLSGFSAWQQIAMVAAGAAFLAGFTVLVYFGQSRRFDRELDRTRAASAEWERRYTNERQTRQIAEAQLRDTPAQGAAPLFTLNLTRGADSGAEPSNAVSISPSARSVVLSLEWQNDPEFQSYRAILTDASGRSVWSADHVPPPSSGALAITLSANLFEPGKYLLTVEGTKAGHHSAVGHYSFRVLRSR